MRERENSDTMLSFFKFFNRKKAKTAIILDIGSASVAAAVVRVKENEVPSILHCVRKKIPITAEVSFDRFLFMLSEAIDATLETCTRNISSPVDAVYAILASPWYMAETHHIEVRYKKQVMVTDALINKLAESKLDEIRARLRKKDIFGGHPEFIDMRNIRIKLNGYETKSPRRKRAKKIEIALFVSAASRRMIDMVQGKVRLHTGREAEITSFLLSSFVATRDMFGEENFLFIDVTGEVTDISLIKDGILAYNGAFPAGKNMFIRKIASKLNAPLEEAESLFSLSVSGEVEPSVRTSVAQAVGDARDVWMEDFDTLIRKLSQRHYLPSSVFITADEDIRTLIRDLVIEKYAMRLNFEEPPEIALLDENFMKKLCLFGEGCHTDAFLAIEAMFTQRTLFEE